MLEGLETTVVNEVKPFKLPWKRAIHCSWAHLKQGIRIECQHKGSSRSDKKALN